MPFISTSEYLEKIAYKSEAPINEIKVIIAAVDNPTSVAAVVAAAATRPTCPTLFAVPKAPNTAEPPPVKGINKTDPTIKGIPHFVPVLSFLITL